MKSKFEACTAKALAFFLLGISLAISGCAAGGANCMTRCKEGPKDYNANSRWICTYNDGSTGGSVSVYTKQDQTSSMCALKIEGRLRSVDSASMGSYETESDCFEKFCIPKFMEICGIEDRCADAKNWLDRPTSRRKYKF